MEEKKKFKKEYISVIISAIIVLLLIALLVLTIGSGSKVEKENVEESNSNVSDLVVDNTNSKCSTAELSNSIKAAKDLVIDYNLYSMPVEEDAGNGEYYTTYEQQILISIDKMTDDIYIKVSNDYNSDIKTITYGDTDSGYYTFNKEDPLKKIRYTFEIYANNDKCKDELLRKLAMDTKVFNPFSALTECVKYPNYSGCQELVDEKLSFSEFQSGLNSYKSGKDEEADYNYNKHLYDYFYRNEENKKDYDEFIGKTKSDNKFVKFIKENKNYILISLTIIGIGILVIVLLVFIRRNRI